MPATSEMSHVVRVWVMSQVQFDEACHTDDNTSHIGIKSRHT